jgi:acetyltransferase-like isoleucine patch superfamily enzyme
MSDISLQSQNGIAGGPALSTRNDRSGTERAQSSNWRTGARFDDPLSYLGRAKTKLYSWWIATIYPFAALGTKLTVSYPFRLCRRSAHQISLGDGVSLGKDAWLNTVGKDTGDVKIVIGDNCNIGARDIFSAKNSIVIESDVMIATSVLIQDHHHAYEDITRPISHQGVTPGGSIRIEKGCWIGQGAAIVCNEGELVIGVNSVISSNALVTRSCPPYSVIVGNPGRLARQFNPAKGVWVGGEAGRSATAEPVRSGVEVNGSQRVAVATRVAD